MILDIVCLVATLTLWIDPHRHACACGKRWWHRGLGNGTNRAAHTCKTCGAEVWKRG